MGDLEKLFDIHWKDAAAIEAAITQKIPKLLGSDQAYQNARRHSDPENVRIEGELAVQRAISTILSDYIELFQQFTQNADFKERLTSLVLALIDGLDPS
jgi:type I restriction enzyme R subunit